eukprot:SAG25_NODE_2415_length_1631_cov_2.789164_2_plen_116_part_00
MDTRSKKQQEIIDALRSENERLKREVDNLKSQMQLQDEDYPGDAQISFEDYIQVVRDCKWRCEDCECGIDVEEGQVPHVYWTSSCHDCYQSRINEYNVHYDPDSAYRYYSESSTD